MGLLAHAVNSGIKPNVDHQTKRVREQINLIVDDIPNRQSWRSLTAPQEVFIEPEAVHAFVKLTSAVAAFINATYLNDIHTTKSATVDVMHFLNMVRKYHGLNKL